MSTGGKAVRFALDLISANTTRVLTVPDKNGIIMLDSDLLGNLDGGKPDSVYGGFTSVDAGGV